MPFAGRAELRGKPPMRAERHEPHRLLPPVAAQDLAHSTRQIVIAKQPEHAAKVGKSVLVRFEKRLLCRMQISAVERRPAGHRSHRKHLHTRSLVAEIDPGFIPVDLSFLSPDVTLRYKRLPPHQTHLAFALAHMVTHHRLGDRGVSEFCEDGSIQPTSGMPLLAWRLTIRRQHLINERHQCTQLRLGTCRVAVLRRHSIGQRLAYHPPVNAKLRSHSRYRADAKFMFPTKLARSNGTLLWYAQD